MGLIFPCFFGFGFAPLRGWVTLRETQGPTKPERLRDLGLGPKTHRNLVNGGQNLVNGGQNLVKGDQNLVKGGQNLVKVLFSY